MKRRIQILAILPHHHYNSFNMLRVLQSIKSVYKNVSKKILVENTERFKILQL